MSSSKVSIDGMADAITKALTEYSDLASTDLKVAVKKAGSQVRKEIQANAPKRTGAYSKSWSVKTEKETSNSLALTVYSKDRYQLAHLLEFGHAKRGGGRTQAFPHIAPAEEKAVEQLEQDIVKALEG